MCRRCAISARAESASGAFKRAQDYERSGDTSTCHFDRRRVAPPPLSFRPEARSAGVEKSLPVLRISRNARNDVCIA